MKVGIRIEGPASGGREYFEAMLDYACEAERLGIDQAWSAEAWGMDAISPLAFLAARTQTMKLGTGIMQVCARTAASTAMTALSMQTVSDGRFLLGLGNSGPQVVEGLHGEPFHRPLIRMRETIEVIQCAIEWIDVKPVLSYKSRPLEVIAKPSHLMEPPCRDAHINEIIEMESNSFKVSESVAV